MPSAEHAPAPQAGPGRLGVGTVIHLADRRGTQTDRAPKAPTAAPAADPAQELAYTLQAMYAATGQ
ncbi:hypothetical protein, partial [Streptomyces roseoviridis]